jgi:hypothetical protein
MAFDDDGFPKFDLPGRAVQFTTYDFDRTGEND